MKNKSLKFFLFYQFLKVYSNNNLQVILFYIVYDYIIVYYVSNNSEP